ncbi:hypothetical protein NX722_10035 [Endozoicomonas gorgoniicola]|uniref:DUF3168 domain-containing protein n=1 Tax=Endozoicomonas gorgoniicola TaxID=1234144 RepID=A0ABT3MR13_9GAMM|nr:hypothetical protein [Endozoicomonas gorgoniicola]MCW7551812.1 hypothetical protein [Endozoicomonas gorgoniicola]MCW7552972.1 hypothetical protein [Endozoicomonas gorgoniicola]
MPSTSNPDEQIIKALVAKLEESRFPVLLGYSIADLPDIEPPAILVQLDSIRELERQGKRAKYRLELTVSGVYRTQPDTTYELMTIARTIRSLLNNARFEGVRKISFSETQFDIAPGNGQLSFADMSVNLEVVF